MNLVQTENVIIALVTIVHVPIVIVKSEEYSALNVHPELDSGWHVYGNYKYKNLTFHVYRWKQPTFGMNFLKL